MKHIENLKIIEQEIAVKIQTIATLKDLELLKSSYLGKNGVITASLKLLDGMDLDAKKSFGAQVNATKEIINNLIEQHKNHLNDQ